MDQQDSVVRWVQVFDSSAGDDVIAFDVEDQGPAGSIGVVCVDQEFKREEMIFLDDQMFAVEAERGDAGPDGLHAAVVVAFAMQIDGEA